MDKFINKLRYKKQYKILNETLKILNDEKIFYIPVGGTILGLYRDKCILPYDDDFDFLIKKEDKKKIIDIMIKNNFIIHYYDWGDAFAIKYKNIYFDDDEYVFVDFFCAETKNNILISSNDKVKCNSKCIIKKKFDNIDQINFMCNDHINEYLDKKYKNWKNKYIIWNHHVKGKIKLKDNPDLLKLSNDILKH